MAESYQIYLNSKYATSYYNNTYKFSLNTLEIDEGHYIYLSVVHVSIPYSFYNVHENNNRLEYISNNSGYVINIPVSNYNINQLISYLSSAMPSFTITYSNKTNKITFKHSTYDFTILSSSTCYRILGFDENKSYTSYGTILVSSNCINLMTINSIFLWCHKRDSNNLRKFVFERCYIMNLLLILIRESKSSDFSKITLGSSSDGKIHE